jgi:hypothetical protein
MELCITWSLCPAPHNVLFVWGWGGLRSSACGLLTLPCFLHRPDPRGPPPPSPIQDFVQVLSMFAGFGFDWPPVIKTVFSAFSLVNFNFELLAPECSVSLNYESKWWVVFSSFPVITAPVLTHTPLQPPSPLILTPRPLTTHMNLTARTPGIV